MIFLPDLVLEKAEIGRQIEPDTWTEGETGAVATVWAGSGSTSSGTTGSTGSASGAGSASGGGTISGAAVSAQPATGRQPRERTALKESETNRNRWSEFTKVAIMCIERCCSEWFHAD